MIDRVLRPRYSRSRANRLTIPMVDTKDSLKTSTPAASGGSVDTSVVVVGDGDLSLEAVLRLAEGHARPVLHGSVRERMRASYELTQRRLKDGHRIYGVTTGYGAAVKNRVPPASSAELSLNLLRFHGCGTGRLLTPTESAAVLAVRLCSVTAGLSGIRPQVAERLCVLISERILPAIPAEGSVGASGDLTPLSYVAAVLIGEREVLTADGTSTRPAREVLAEHGLEPLELGPKEALALMNGTSVATALGILAYAGARRLARVAAAVTALASRAIGGNPEHFEALLHQAKPHPGQLMVAQWIRQDLARLRGASNVARLQDRYSIRCTPHVVGVLVDALTWFSETLTIELNGVSDNPIVDPEHEAILHGGNFYGSHIGFVVDGLKTAVANVADLLDRQLVLLCISGETGGLPDNLVAVKGDLSCIHHGFKAMSISASALTAEALKQSMPMSVFSRSTESHNQDKVPMATIGSRDALRVIELTEQVASIAALAVCQAADLGGVEADELSLYQQIRQQVPQLVEDRRMDGDIQTVLELLRSGKLTQQAGRQAAGSAPNTEATNQ